jgi:hypothetical protein
MAKIQVGGKQVDFLGSARLRIVGKNKP